MRLGGKVNTYPLSSGSIGKRVERYREAVRIVRPPCCIFAAAPSLKLMNVFELTRALVDIDSVTPNEEQVGIYLASYLS